MDVHPINENGKAKISYVYYNKTPKNKSTDERAHHGAALLEINKNKEGALVLEGDYWTNRNWTKGLNTAGRITLIKKINPSSFKPHLK